MGKVTVRGEAARLEAINIVKNGGTLEDAAKATGFGANYVRQLCNSRGIEWKNHTRQSRLNEIVRLANEGYTAKEIAEELAVSYTLVSARLREAGVKAAKKIKRPFKLDHEAIRVYYSEGHTARETAAHFGSSKDYVRQICKGIRFGNQYTNGLFDREGNAIKHINERTPWFEYAGNYTGTDGYVDLKCKTCGTIARKSFQTVRAGSARCDECVRIKAQGREEAKKARKEELKYQRYFRLSNLQAEQLSMQTCVGCGQLFVPARRGLKYCSAECSTRTNNSIGKDKRLKRMANVLVDKDIDLKRLYKRDKGKCAICGDTCDWDDFIVKDDVFIAGNNYPSIDHIVPLSKGGLHAWDNVQLAHRFCNSKKGKRVSPPGRT